MQQLPVAYALLEISPSAVTALHNSTKSYIHSHFYFCRLIGNIAIRSNCSAQFYKYYVPGYFYFSQLSYIVR